MIHNKLSGKREIVGRGGRMIRDRICWFLRVPHREVGLARG